MRHQQLFPPLCRLVHSPTRQAAPIAPRISAEAVAAREGGWERRQSRAGATAAALLGRPPRPLALSALSSTQLPAVQEGGPQQGGPSCCRAVQSLAGNREQMMSSSSSIQRLKAFRPRPRCCRRRSRSNCSRSSRPSGPRHRCRCRQGFRSAAGSSRRARPSSRKGWPPHCCSAHRTQQQQQQQCHRPRQQQQQQRQPARRSRRQRPSPPKQIATDCWSPRLCGCASASPCAAPPCRSAPPLAMSAPHPAGQLPRLPGQLPEPAQSYSLAPRGTHRRLCCCQTCRCQMCCCHPAAPLSAPCRGVRSSLATAAGCWHRVSWWSIKQCRQAPPPPPPPPPAA